MTCLHSFIENIATLLSKILYLHFQSGFYIFIKEWNITFVVLIPKKQNASQFNNFRPISLTHTSYKFISKILANRIKPHLGKMISPTNQVAFLEGKWINENIVLARQVIHIMNQCRQKKGWFGIKIDFLATEIQQLIRDMLVQVSLN